MIEILFIIILLISIVSLKNNWNIKAKKKAFWLFLFSLILFDGLRWEMGTDWVNYYRAFNNILIETPPGIEIGFKAYLEVMRNITSSYSLFLFITTMFIYIGIFYTVFKITGYSLFSTLYLAGTVPWYSGALRQMVASVFFTLALQALISKKPFKFLILLLTGLLFHVTILTFLPIYLIYGSPQLVYILVFIALFILTFFFGPILSYLESMLSVITQEKSFERLLQDGSSEFNLLFGYARKVGTIAGLYYFSKKGKISNVKNSIRVKSNNIKDDIINKNIYFFLFLSSLSILFYFIGTKYIPTIASRLDIYTGIISTAILIGLIESRIVKKNTKFFYLIFILILVLVFYSRLSMMNLFHPYSSIFFNFNLHRELY